MYKSGETVAIQTQMPVKVHPDVAGYIDIILHNSIPTPKVLAAYDCLNGFLKKGNLSLSFFHHGALFETGVGIMGLKKTLQIYNPVKVYKALVKGELDVFKKEAIAKDGLENNLQLGASVDIPVTQIQRALDTAAFKTKDILVVNRVTKSIKVFNEKWDVALWSTIHDPLKLTAYEHLVSKMNPNKDVLMQKREIAQFVNDTFGGQNWDTLMVHPETVKMLSRVLLSTDWTISTLRQAASPTSLGRMYKETAGLRAKEGSKFWLRSTVYSILGMSMLNYTMRKWDEKKNPQYYKGKEMKFIDYLPVGNAPGHRTHVFMGRNKDGSEVMYRPLKQFREAPELLEDPLKKIGGKAAPLLQLGVTTFTGKALSGFAEDDFTGKKGWAHVAAAITHLPKAIAPYSFHAFADEDFHAGAFIMPVSKGMTRGGATNYFKEIIQSSTGKEEMQEGVKEIYFHALRNNLPAGTLFSSALNIVKSEQSKDLNKNIKNIKQATDELIKATTITDIERLQNLLARLYREQMDKQIGMHMLTQVNAELEVYLIKKGSKK